MERIIYVIVAMLTMCIAGVQAEEIEVPEDAPRETWQLVYDDYRSMWNHDHPEYFNMTRDIAVVRGEDCLYLQGMAKSCPDSWVKATVADSECGGVLLLWGNQPVDAAGYPSTAYLNCRSVNIDSGDGHTFFYYGVACKPSAEPLAFYRNLMADEILYESESKRGYWIQDAPNKGLDKTILYDTEGNSVYGEEFGDMEIYLRPRLIDKTAGIGGLRAEDGEAEVPIYTLSGIKADRNNLAPGIYVSRGKKIVVR